MWPQVDPTTGYRYNVWTAEAGATPRYEGVGFGNNYNAGFGDPDILSLTSKTYGIGQAPGAPMAPTGAYPMNNYNGGAYQPFATVGAAANGWANYQWLIWLIVGLALGWFGRQWIRGRA